MGQDFDIHLCRLDNERLALKSSGARISELLAGYDGADVCLLVSGGSALTVLDHVSLEHVSSHTSISVVDERYGVSEADTNYFQLMRTAFAKEFVAAGGRVSAVDLSSSESLTMAEDAFVEGLYVIGEGDTRVITLLGIGPDGHTAGIMPYAEDAGEFMELFLDPPRAAVGYDVGAKNQFPLRVTASGSFLVDATDHTIVYAVGESKKHVLADILSEKGDVHVYPGRIIHAMKDVYVYTDQKLEYRM